MNIGRAAAFAMTAMAAAACSDGVAGPGEPAVDVDLALPWTTAAVAEAGGSQALVDRGVARARENHRIRSLLVVRDGRLVVEEYFGGAGPDDLQDVRSVTKSVVSALAGTVIARGDLPGLDAAIDPYIRPLVPNLDPAKGAITVGDLLTMTSGLEWDETGGFGSYTDWIRSGSHLGYLLNKPFAAQPGSRFTYNSAAVHLLGVVLEQASGMPLPALAQFSLFDPMGIASSRWEQLGGLQYNGGAGLDLRPRDLARFGQLYLQQGSSGGRQILPREWVLQSVSDRFDWRIRLGALDGISYGYLWWLVPGAPEPIHFAWGYGGQFIVVVPELTLVVVATSDWRGMSQDGGADLYERMTMDVIVEDIIPAFRQSAGAG